MSRSSRPALPGRLRLRRSTARDCGLILKLIRDLAAYERLLHEVVAGERLLRRHLFGPRPAAEVILAHCGGVPAGFALYFFSFSTFLGRPGIYLEDLFVRPEFRRRGIGQALLKRVAREAVRKRCGRLEWSVLGWNKPSIRFYRSLRARPMSEWTIFRLTGDSLRELGKG